jgi:hypothetical protein
VSTSPGPPEDIRAAAEVHRELGPEYSDAVVAAFLDKVDREVDARVKAHLADRRRGRVARLADRRMLVMGVAIGACAGALISGVSMAHLSHTIRVSNQISVPGVLKSGPDGTKVTVKLPDGRITTINLPPGAPIPPGAQLSR